MAKMAQVLTANRLRDGEVVYWRAGQWLTGFADAEVFPEASTADMAVTAAAESVRDRVVVNPYLFEVREVEGSIRPVKEREIIRAAGPTVRLDLGKQAGHVQV